MADAGFTRPHHQAIARLLYALDGGLLLRHRCLFGGGTAIALRYGEYRESRDVDLLVSSVEGYRELRQLTREGLAPLFRDDAPPFAPERDVRSDQYGIRTVLEVVGRAIKFEIVREGRIQLDIPEAGNSICGIATLSPVDMAAEKLLANSDRWHDDGAFNRDVIDLAMMRIARPVLDQAVSKALAAYGDDILKDLAKAIDRMENRVGWMERCMTAMAIGMPKAQLWKRVRLLKKIL